MSAYAPHDDTAAAQASRDVIAGTGLATAAAMTVLAMAHHPTGAHGASGMGEFIHGTMIVLLTVVFVGFLHFARRRGLDKLVVLGGLAVYTISVFAHVGAATINGFVVPALAAHGDEAVSHEIFILMWELNQALARLGVFATGVAYALWSIDFLRRGALEHRVVGVAGLATAVVTVALLIARDGKMDVETAFVVYAGHALFSIVVGVQMARRRI